MAPTKAELELLLLNIKEDLESLIADEKIEEGELEDIIASISEELGLDFEVEEPLINEPLDENDDD